jgi:predicted RNA methylase
MAVVRAYAIRLKSTQGKLDRQRGRPAPPFGARSRTARDRAVLLAAFLLLCLLTDAPGTPILANDPYLSPRYLVQRAAVSPRPPSPFQASVIEPTVMTRRPFQTPLSMHNPDNGS